MRKSRLLLPVLVAALSLPVLVSALSVGFFGVQGDEFAFGWIGARAMQGLVPYRDFFTIHPPGVISLVALWFKAFGATLSSLRLLQIIVGAASAGLLCRALLDLSLRPFLAAAASLTVPLAFFISWPVPSHHYLAVAAGIAALVVGGPGFPVESGRGRLLLAGALAGFAGLAVQHAGALVVVWLLVGQCAGGDRVRNMAWVSSGVALPLLAYAAVLAGLGALPAAFSDLVIYPLRFYPGGFDDISVLSSCAGELASGYNQAGTAPPELSDEAWASLGTKALSMVLPPACAIATVAGAAIRRGREDALRLVRCAALFLFLGMGWWDWVHTVLWAPFFLLLLAESSFSGTPKWVSRLFAGWVLLLLFLSVVFWGNHWSRVAPRLSGVTEVDSWYSRQGPVQLVSGLPDSASNPPVVSLPYGSAIYFYYAPERPPLDWVMPPGRGWNAPWEYRVLADFCTRRKIPYILLSWGYEGKFQTEPSPLRDILVRDYGPFAETPWGLLLKRNDHRP